MVFSIKYALILSMFFFLFGCSKKDNEQIVRDQLSNIPEIAYIEAKTLLDQESFDDSLIAFKQIEKKYPLSNWALKSKIMIIFINYLKLDYENASFEVERFINKYPDYEDIDYVYYLRALIAYEQIKNPGLDALNTNKALLYFEELIRRFPTSKYSKDGNQKLILVKTVLAGKDVHIGLYYLEQQKYLAALNRFQKVIDYYEPNKYTPEALHRIVEIYYILGMQDDAKRVAAVLGHNYPESIWYEKSYKIVGKKNIDNDDSKSWAGRLFKKIF